VTKEELQTLRDRLQPFLEDEIEFDQWTHEQQLQIAVASIWQATGSTVAYAFRRRDEAEALAEWFKRGALSKEKIMELLEHEQAASQASSDETVVDASA
jgi:hypothetical protein